MHLTRLLDDGNGDHCRFVPTQAVASVYTTDVFPGAEELVQFLF